MISVVIPTLNAQAHLPRSLPPLVDGVVAGLVREVIVSDGGSTDATVQTAEAAGCEVIVGPAGRGPQLIAGANRARGDWILFLHADTALDAPWVREAKQAIEASGASERAAAFRFALDDSSARARHLEWWVGVRCGLAKLPYGDQALLISRKLYDSIGGFRAIPLMEDVDLVRRLGARRVLMLKTKAVTSAARFQKDGYSRRSLLNLVLLARFLMGADPAKLARAYD
jgi:rSAM/selenodomain-associated transferase 2